MSKADELLPDDYDFSQDEEPKLPVVVAAMTPLPYVYDEEDSRCVDILDKVAAFCGKEFTEVPPNPDGEKDPETGEIEGGVPVPLAEDGDEEKKPKPGDPDFVIDPDDPDKTGQIDPDIPGEPYPAGTGEEPNPELDSLRQEYQEALRQNMAEKTSYWASVWQVIRFLSNVNCWTDNATDTFIVQVRTQIYKAKQVNPCTRACCHCDEDQIVIPLEYAPLYFQTSNEEVHHYNPEEDFAFVGGVISAVVNGKPQQVKIDSVYLNEHYDSANERIYIMRDDFPDILLGQRNECCCLCLRDLTITLYYNAGYKTIPEALLPLFCPLLARIEDAKQSPNDCAMAMTQVSGLLKSKKVGDVQYTWSEKDSEASKTQALYTELFNIASIAELYGLNRCAIVTAEEAGDVI